VIELIHGDCLAEFSKLKGRPMFAYIDPPFMSGKKHYTKDGRLAFDDRWSCSHAYLDEIVDRILECWVRLHIHATMVVHLDSSAVWQVERMLRASIGSPASEVIWRYRRWPSKQRNFQRVHDVMLRYVKGPGFRWNQLYEPLAPSTRKTWGDRKQEALVVNGKRKRSLKTAEPSHGVPMGDVWDDIGIIAPSARERTGYPTQKPEKLIERWLAACTDPGDLVLDPMCGSGTTLAVAASMGRRAIGIDSSEVAIEFAEKRLAHLRNRHPDRCACGGLYVGSRCCDCGERMFWAGGSA
jgi:site-specific DNA-methyltransferase (adenine-specific)